MGPHCPPISALTTPYTSTHPLLNMLMLPRCPQDMPPTPPSMLPSILKLLQCLQDDTTIPPAHLLPHHSSRFCTHTSYSPHTILTLPRNPQDMPPTLPLTPLTILMLM
ncbi:hypothetical protein O181_071455 [Austropuccinia psidii MF-1]|uniref:Uncharacterized protein n=1 Tax=Austropuccinia psidii MF-1 TaxID=1389203 RepID=A0A9Q3F6R4_9BASI|nr:hypothetical protein [Austropuccinia psidii MF-1]